MSAGRLPFLERIRTGPPLLLDGGMGSALIAAGLPAGAAPDGWCLTHPDAVTAVHRACVEAGSDAVHTNTFGANLLRLATAGLDGDCERINHAAVALARAAGPRYVVGDLGPVGEYLPPVGAGDLARWRSALVPQVRALADAGVDAFHIETMSDLREARLALEVALTEAPGVPVLASLTFERKKRGFFTIMGDPPGPALRALASDGAAAVGANCSLASQDMAALVTALGETGAILVAQPNAGQPLPVAGGPPRYAQQPDEFASDMAGLARQGVRLLGGCCGTDHRFIAALHERLAKEPA